MSLPAIFGASPDDGKRPGDNGAFASLEQLAFFLVREETPSLAPLVCIHAGPPFANRAARPRASLNGSFFFL